MYVLLYVNKQYDSMLEHGFLLDIILATKCKIREVT